MVEKAAALFSFFAFLPTVPSSFLSLLSFQLFLLLLSFTLQPRRQIPGTCTIPRYHADATIAQIPAIAMVLTPPRRRSRCRNVRQMNMTSLGFGLLSLSFTAHFAHRYRGPIAAAAAAGAAAAFLPQQQSAHTLPSSYGCVPGGTHSRSACSRLEVRLQAKKSRGGRRQKSSRGGTRRGRRQKDQQVEEEGATNNNSGGGMPRSVPAVPPPKSYRRSTLRIRPLQTLASLQAPPSSSLLRSRPHIDIAMFDIDDADWWEAKTLLQEAGERRRGGGGDITNSQA